MVIKVRTCPLTIIVIYFYQKGTTEDLIISERAYFKTTVKVTPGAWYQRQNGGQS